MAKRIYTIEVDANITGFQAKMKAAGASVKNAFSESGKWIDKNSAAIDSASNSLAKYGAVAVAGVGLAVKKFADFDSAMSGVQAATMESAGNMAKLRQAAIDAGADTQYSATESAAAITELGKAGLSTADILSGGLSGALNLAASDQIEVAKAAEITSAAMTQFKLAGSDAGHIADLLAAGAGKALGGVEDLGMALNQTGAVANSAGLSIEETTAGLAAFAAAGTTGSDAGTSFKSMLQRLTPQSKESEKMMSELGISAFDAQGEFVGLASFAGNLQTALASLTPQQRQAAMATMFGSDAVRAATALYNEGEAGIRKWESAVNDSGYASRQAAIRTDNLKGDIERLGGAIDTALIQGGEGVGGSMRGVVQSITGVVDALGKVPPEVSAVTMSIVGAGGLVALGMAGMGKLTLKITAAKTAFMGMGRAGKVASLSGAAIGLAAAALAIWAQNSAEAAAKTDAYVDSLDKATHAATNASREIATANLSEGLKEGLGGAIGLRSRNSAFDIAEDMGLGLKLVTDAAMGSAEALAEYQVQRDAAIDAGRDVSGRAGLLDKAIAGEANSLERAVEISKQKEEANGGLAASEDGAANSATKAASATDAYRIASAAGIDTSGQYTDALKEQLKTLSDLAGLTLDARSAEREYRDSIDEAKEAIKSATEEGVKQKDLLDQSTKAGRDNQAALDGIAEASWRRIDALREEGASEDTLQKKMKKSRDAFIDTAKKMGLSQEKAEKLADKLGLIPSDVKVKVDYDDGGTTAKVQSLTDMLKAMGALVIKPKVQVPNYVEIDAPRPSGKKATGGAINGPGSATSDTAGLFALSNGEHVLTAKNVQNMGGQGAVYRLRSMVDAGWKVPGLAKGGAVGNAEKDVRDAESEVKAAQNRKTKAARKLRDTKDKSAKAAARRANDRAADDLSAARQDLKDAKAELKRVERERDDRKERASYRSEFLQDRRRGDTVQSAVREGNGLSAVDDLLGMASSGAFSKLGSKMLRDAATQSEKKILALNKSLEAAKDNFDKLSALYDDVRGGLSGGFSFDSLLGQTDSLGFAVGGSGNDLAAGASAYAGKISTLGTKIVALRKAGATQALIEQIARMPLDTAIQVADAFLSDPGSASTASSALSAIDAEANKVGWEVTKGATGADKLWWDAGKGLGSSAVDALLENANAIGSSIANTILSVTSKSAGSSSWISSVSPGLRAVAKKKKTAKKKALGGPVSAGQPYLVGEEGPELFWPGASGAIIPSRLTIPAVQASSGVTNTAQMPTAQEIASALASELRSMPIDMGPVKLVASASDASSLVQVGAGELDRSNSYAWQKYTGRAR